MNRLLERDGIFIMEKKNEGRNMGSMEEKETVGDYVHVIFSVDYNIILIYVPDANGRNRFGSMGCGVSSCP